MDAKEFCYWLHGFFELRDKGELSLVPAQVNLIKQHLDLVFTQVVKSEPSIDGDLEKAHEKFKKTKSIQDFIDGNLICESGLNDRVYC